MAMSMRDNTTWIWGGALAIAGHGAALGAVLALGVADPVVRIEDPVVLVELPPEGAPAPVEQAQPEPTLPQQDAVPQPEAPSPEPETPEFTAPEISAPLPRAVVTTPPPAPKPRPKPPQPQVAAAAPTQPAPAPARKAEAVAPRGSDSGAARDTGNDPKARREQADYFAMLSSHLNRKKRYPSEAKKAREQGVVTVRFTVHRDGSITGAEIKNSSGHALLDQATLTLMQRVAPLPRFPSSMTKDSVTLSLPIDYSLRTS